MKPPHDHRPGGGRPPGERGQSRGQGAHGQRTFGGAGPRREHAPQGGPGPGRSGDRPQGGGQNRGFGEGGRHGQGGQRHGGPGQAPGPREHDQRGPRPQRQDFRPGQDRQGQPSRDRDRQSREGQPFKDRGDRPFRDRPRPHHHDQPRRGPDAPHGTLWLYGQHAVAAALANPTRRLRRLLLTEEAEVTIAQRVPPPWPLQPEHTERNRLDNMLGRDIAHQGAALLADPLPTPSLQQALERPGPIVVLDQVTDPRNVGAILRSAAAFGAAAVIAQERNAPEETGALAKAASGALETIPLLRAVNIARTLIALKAANIWCVGLDAGGAPLSGAALAGRRIALVLGAEGDGLRRLTRETCDELAGLQMPGARGRLDSLNVSAAAAVSLYELTRSEGGPR